MLPSDSGLTEIVAAPGAASQGPQVTDDNMRKARDMQCPAHEISNVPSLSRSLASRPPLPGLGGSQLRWVEVPHPHSREP